MTAGHGGREPAWVTRIESGQTDEVGARLLSVLLAVVGLDLNARAFPGSHPLRDEGHQRLLARVRALLPTVAPWQTEFPLPELRDQRAFDAMTRSWSRRVAVEAELRLTDLQSLERRLSLKVRDSGVDRLILALADTRNDRAALRSARWHLRSTFSGAGTCCTSGAPLDP